MKQDKKTEIEKAKEFMATNWWILWVLILVVFLHDLFVGSSINEKFEKALEKIELASKGVVMLDYSGRAVFTEKVMMDVANEGFKAAVVNSLRFYTIKDWQTLSNKFSTKVSEIEDMEKINKDLIEFKENFLQRDSQAQSDFVAYEKTLLYLMSNDNLPEKITPINTVATRYVVQGNTFEITVAIEVVQSVYLMESDSTVEKSGTIEIKAEGLFNPETGTPVNPLGIRFTSFKPTFLKKR